MLEVLAYPAPILTRPSDPTVKFDNDLRVLVERMAETMYTENGVGLASPQVGVSQRVLIMDPSGGEESNQLSVLINPEVTWRSPEVEMKAEGCLSMPGLKLQVVRPSVVDVKYFDLEGTQHQVRYGEWLARIVQHEIDHLDGIMMIDRVGAMQRRLVMKGQTKNK